ncbi:NAD-P-binding protein [Infundibulicybe gibba]|nr:NAD-P-binding protein [Infundibulicybe gibba]
MADNTKKPSAVIFGGLNTFSRALAAKLVPVDGEALVSHLRIVDKFSVDPPTTYIGTEFPKILKKPEVEYRQANLTVAAKVAANFEPPEGQAAYDYVFDFTGEVRHDRTEMIQITTTFRVAQIIGLEAAKRNVKAYIRLQQPFYETPNNKVPNDEKVDVKPAGTLGIWWHETIRMLAAIENLNLVILRVGLAYGPYTNFGLIASVMTVASVYGYLKKPMKSLWSPGKHPNNTVHVEDIAGALWACAEWMGPLGRTAANSVAGEVIPFHNEKSKVKEVEGMTPYDDKPIAPLFNLVDDSDSTYLHIGQTVTSFFGTTFEFFNLVESTMYKVMSDQVDDINEHHVGGWTQMIQTSNPPIPNTPLSAYMDKYTLDKHVISFSNKKFKDIVGYQLTRPQINHDMVAEMVEKWKSEGSWPILD